MRAPRGPPRSGLARIGLHPVSLTFRPARPEEREACIAIWVHACAARDGRRVPGLAETARAKFDHSVGWLVAESSAGLAGFVLPTAPGTTCPDLLQHALAVLAQQGYRHAVLHVFADNAGAVRLYESTGWRRVGEEVMIDPLGQRPSWTYRHLLDDDPETGR